MKECELCGVRAWMYCEADHASLCWDCDEKVHGTNFLVAKHPRTLLCHVCQSMSLWTSCGTKLTPTVSVCQSCLVVQSHNNNNNKLGDDHLIDLIKQHQRESEAENEEEEEEDYNGEEEDDDDVEEEEDENQVVPWSPPETSCSGSEAEISVSKRIRQNVHVDSSDDDEDFDGTGRRRSVVHCDR